MVSAAETDKPFKLHALAPDWKCRSFCSACAPTTS